MNKNAKEFTSKKIAFTLAEVLITLGVIGIVAALTIPTMINNYQKKVTTAKLKLAYSQLYNAIKLSEIDNGSVSTWDMREDVSGKEFFEKYLKKYLKISKEGSYEECAPKNAVYLDGQEVDVQKYGYYFVLNNGTTVKIWPRGIRTEVNVFFNNKNPNVVGKDRFAFIITTKAFNNSVYGKIPAPGFYPYGYGYTRDYLKTKGYPCAKKGARAGVFCAALIMLDDWEIKDDYPW